MRLGARIAAWSWMFAVGTGVVSGIARAQPATFAGAWRAGPTRIDVRVEAWGGDCGTRPESMSVPGGGNVAITTDGDHLVIRGSRTQRTNGCFSENRSVQRVAASYQDGVWRSVCRTPPEDPRAETGTYTMRAVTADRLELRDESRYDWRLNESRCAATLTSTQVYERVAAPSPAATDAGRPSACTPGPAARLTLLPASTNVERGGRVCFRVRAGDARGCVVPNANARFDVVAIGDAAGGTMRDACFEAPTADGAFRVDARAGALHASARVVVKTLDFSDLVAARAEQGDPASASVEATVGAVTGSSSRVRAAARVSGVSSTAAWLALAGGLGLAIAAFLLWRRRTSKTEEAPSPADEAPRPSPPVAPSTEGRVFCTTCRREFPSGTRFCPTDSTPLISVAAAPTTPASLICPTCRRGYPGDKKQCPHDGEELIPYAMFTALAKQATHARDGQKVCPTCGERFGRAVTFCGKDGTELVPMN